MNFVANFLSNLAQKAIGSGNFFQTSEIASSAVQRWECLENEGNFSLYKDKNLYKGILASPYSNKKVFLVFSIPNQAEAKAAYTCLSFKLQTLIHALPEQFHTEDVQKISDAIRKHPSFGPAHIASYLGLCDLFKSANVIQSVNEADVVTRKTPLHIAVEEERFECIRELLFLNARLDCVDTEGRTVFHLAAKCKNSSILQMLTSKDSSLLNAIDISGMTPLHVACSNDCYENVEILLRWKSDPMVSGSGTFPIHCAIESGSICCVKTLLRWNAELLHMKKKETGESVLHVANSKEMIHFLVNLGCPVELVNSRGQSALHTKVEAGDLSSVLGLLTVDANPSARDKNGNGALHLAIEQDRSDLVQLLIVFGADINLCNNAGVSPRHAAACSTKSNRHEILNYLHLVGATRCDQLKKNCAEGCKFNAAYNGVLPTSASNHVNKIKTQGEEFSEQMAFNAALSRSDSLYSMEENLRHKQRPGDRVLCLDGGGIRGLVTIKILMALEHFTGRPIRDSFDWMGGTSTGGILAMGILQGKSLTAMMGSYFRLKDEVFQGKRPYKSEALEGFLKKELGEWSRMTDIEKPRVMLMSLLADRLPSELFAFKNYEIPGAKHDPIPSPFKKFPPLPRPQDQLVWQAVRATGAAPTYFRASGRFIDGGLISNNPTLDVLTEIHKFNCAKKASGNSEEVSPLHVVASIGTGRLPLRYMEDFDVFRPEGILDCSRVVFGAKNLGQILVDLATQSEGQAVNRAASWCNMIDVPFFRLNPQLSDDIPLDCTDDSILVNMLWETQCYLFKHHEKLIQLANLLV